ncbi:hypothetical protein CLOM621_07801 [Clostridium sp. M62/1]|nr:hypothetical protein CLOM621_07801 [Clostridium sp. M62/1]
MGRTRHGTLITGYNQAPPAEKQAQQERNRHSRQEREKWLKKS